MLGLPRDTTRRSLLKLIAATIGTAFAWRPGLALGSATDARPFDHPPTYVPPDFKFRRRVTGLPDGFGGGLGEVTYLFVNRDVPLANAKPLLVCESVNPRRPLGATAPKPGSRLNLALDSGDVVPATYHDGMWWLLDDGQLKWNSADVHSLTFAARGVTYGVRGMRSTGVSFGELQKVAASLG